MLRPTEPAERKANGVGIKGWVVDNGNSYSEEKRFSSAPGAWRESWGLNNEIFLRDNGELYSYSWGAEEGGYPAVMKRTDHLEKLTARDLVGQEGKPFSGYSAKLRRMKWI